MKACTHFSRDLLALYASLYAVMIYPRKMTANMSPVNCSDMLGSIYTVKMIWYNNKNH